mmetsp:Transcript_46969/g.108979  ORF Transcript_46969/g.108979 Transcript_46969/m.108979 type:complete len:325 (-) Transcript_46969:169-1143(-)
MVSPSATSSCERISARFLYSVSSCSHSLRMFAKKFSSASMASNVLSTSRFALATSFNKLASSVSASSFCFVAASISPSFAARKFWKLTSAMKSAFCASERSSENWSSIWAKRPKIPPLRELYDFAPAAAPLSSFGFASLPICSSVFSHGSRRPASCSKEAAARRGRNPAFRWTKPSKDPKTSKRSFCIRPWNLGWCCSTRSRSCKSTSRARLASGADCPLLLWTSCTFSSTSTASLRSDFVSFMSASAAWKASNSFSRVAVAVASASLSSSMSFSKLAISVFNSPSFAAASSKKVFNSSTCAFPSSIAFPFSFSFVWHQHMNLS